MHQCVQNAEMAWIVTLYLHFLIGNEDILYILSMKCDKLYMFVWSLVIYLFYFVCWLTEKYSVVVKLENRLQATIKRMASKNSVQKPPTILVHLGGIKNRPWFCGLGFLTGCSQSWFCFISGCRKSWEFVCPRVFWLV